MNQSEKINELLSSLVKAQALMGGAVKDSKNPFFKSSYADLGSVIKAIKEPFAKFGLGYVQFPIGEGGVIGVKTRIVHESGQWMESEFTMPLSKVDPQALGSAITYFRRYSLQAMVGIPSVDDDAQSFMVKPLSNVTLKTIIGLVEKTGSDTDKILRAFNVEAFSELDDLGANKLISMLEKKLESTSENS